MQITEEQKQQLIDLNDSRVNEILELNPYNAWYKFEGMNHFLMYVIDKSCRYGFGISGNWHDKSCGHEDISVGYIKATKQEVEQVLVCFLQKKLLLY